MSCPTSVDSKRVRVFGAATGLGIGVLSAGPDAVARGIRQHGAMGRSVLIVDDDPGYRAAVRLLLEADGDYAVSEAVSGSAAVTEIARGNRPDLVLLDLGLPGEDVFAVTRELNALAADVVIVLCSVREADEFGGRIARSPAAGFLAKAQLSAVELSRFTAAAADDDTGAGQTDPPE